jgi:hypothetical protein
MEAATVDRTDPFIRGRNTTLEPVGPGILSALDLRAAAK